MPRILYSTSNMLPANPVKPVLPDPARGIVEIPRLQNLVGFWGLGRIKSTTVLDLSGQGNHGVATSMDGGNVRPGQNQWSKSATFDGTNDYVSVAAPAGGVLDFGTGNFSISVWFVSSDANIKGIAIKSNDVTTGVGYKFYGTAGKLVIRIADGVNNRFAWTTPATFNDGAWHHACGVVDRVNDLAIYIDGIDYSVLGGDALGAIGSISNALTLNIGAESDGGNAGQGDFADICIYNVALTAAEVAALYAMQRRGRLIVN